MPRRAALFDMDRTLVRHDTAGLYTRYRRDIGEASLKDVLQVAWWMMQYTLGVIDAPGVALQALKGFRGKEERWLIEQCDGWFRDYVLPEVLASGRIAVRRHLDEGAFVAIVTGATIYAAKPLAKELGIDVVVCSEIEVDSSGLFTGQVIEPLCYGAGKRERARIAVEREGLDLADATFYSDSITDLPLLDAVKDRVVVNPDARLRRVARRRGWPIEKW